MTTRKRRVSYPPLRFDWSHIGGPLYRAIPDSTFTLYAFRANGGSWRWSISMVADGGLAPIHVGDRFPTLIRAKLAAESWYAEHGGKPMTEKIEIWETIVTDDDPLPF